MTMHKKNFNKSGGGVVERAVSLFHCHHPFCTISTGCSTATHPMDQKISGARFLSTHSKGPIFSGDCIAFHWARFICEAGNFFFNISTMVHHLLSLSPLFVCQCMLLSSKTPLGMPLNGR